MNAERNPHAILHSTNPPTSVNGRSLQQGGSFNPCAEFGKQGLGIPGVFAESFSDIFGSLASQPVDYHISDARQNLRSIPGSHAAAVFAEAIDDFSCGL
jgi:hypothetical protein